MWGRGSTRTGIGWPRRIPHRRGRGSRAPGRQRRLVSSGCHFPLCSKTDETKSNFGTAPSRQSVDTRFIRYGGGVVSSSSPPPPPPTPFRTVVTLYFTPNRKQPNFRLKPQRPHSTHLPPPPPDEA